MQITRLHTFDAPIDAVWAMFSDAEAHVTKFTKMGHREIEVLRTESDGNSFRIDIRRIVDIEVPGFARKVISPTNTVTSIDEWTRVDDATCTGRYTVETGNPVTIAGTTALRAGDDGTTSYEVTVDVAVKVPLIGGRIAEFAKGDIHRQLDAEFACADEWLAEHAPER